MSRKVALITGSSRGIGRAAAARLAREGYAVCINYIEREDKAEELVEEGSRLHNCLRTYIDKVARGDCLIFFIRKADRPDEPFYAMEYCNGEINQLYADHNEHDSNYDVVYTFCSDFIKILNDLKVDTKSLAKAVA